MRPGAFVGLVPANPGDQSQEWNWEDYSTMNSVLNPTFSLTDSVTSGEKAVGLPVHMWPLKASLARAGKPNAQWTLLCVSTVAPAGVKEATTSTA